MERYIAKKQAVRMLCMLSALLLLIVRPLPAHAASSSHLSGDMDGDGTVCAADAAAVLRAADGAVPLDAGESALADTTGDQTVGGTDGLAILLLTVGKIRDFADLVLPGGTALLGTRHLDKFSYLGVMRMVNGYLSRQVSVRISTFTCEGAVCYLADIYIQRIESLKTAFGSGEYGGAKETVQVISKEAGALLSVNGDQCSRMTGGPMVRNGVWYRSDLEPAIDICVLYKNGEMETISRKLIDVDALKDRDVYQIWQGGQPLLDAEGKALTRFVCLPTVQKPCSRTAIGYFEPGHYCLLVTDGTQNPDSEGMTLPVLAALFERIGCQSAFNLYGDTYSLMCLDAEPYSTPFMEERYVSDIIYICEPES